MSRRVLQVITRLNVGGPARIVIPLNESLPSRGFEASLVSGVEGPNEGRIEPRVPVQVVPTLRRELRPSSDMAAYRALAAIVRERRPDVVHTHMAKAGALGRLAAHRAHTPAIAHTFHGHVLEGYFSGAVARSFLAAERRLARRTHALVAVSSAVKEELLGLGIGRAEQWRVIPLGLELDPLLAPPPERSAARASLGLPTAGPVVGIVGRLVQIKDHDTFLLAAAGLARRRPDVTFAVVGDGELRPELEERGRRMLGDRIVFTGWVLDLPTLYASIDVVALTSRNEGTPVALIEAAAAGVPAVATAVGGVADVVLDRVSGALVRACDAEGVAGEIEALLADPARASAWGSAAREHVRHRFAYKRLEDDVVALYEELIGRTVGSGA